MKISPQFYHLNRLAWAHRFFLVFVIFLTGSFVSIPWGHAATFQVNSTSDVVDFIPGDGLCATSPSGLICTLRAAIMEANVSPGKDTILLPESTQIYKLYDDSGSLIIEDSLDILGGGAQGTIIDGTSIQDHVFVVSSNIEGLVTFSNLTVQGGGKFSSDLKKSIGGGIMVHSQTLIDHCHITKNFQGVAVAPETDVNGNPINDVIPSLEINDSTISLNIPYGGVAAFSSDLIINNSTISGNQALQDLAGGITFLYERKPFSSLLYTASFKSLTITDNFGFLTGGLYVGNAQPDPYDPTAQALEMTLKNSLIAQNKSYEGQPYQRPIDCFIYVDTPVYSQGYNLIGQSKGCNFHANPTDKLGTAKKPLKPRLGLLEQNGGGLPTHALLKGSPAIDAGSYQCTDHHELILLQDERGVSRQDGNLDGFVSCDIGAYEYVPYTKSPEKPVSWKTF